MLKKCKQLFEYQHLLLLKDIWWLKLKSVYEVVNFFCTSVNGRESAINRVLDGSVYLG